MTASDTAPGRPSRLAAVDWARGLAVLGALADQPVALQLVTQAASDPRPIPDIPRQLADAARKFRDAWIERRIATVGSRLADPSLDHEAKVAAVREQQELRALRRAPLAAISDV